MRATTQKRRALERAAEASHRFVITDQGGGSWSIHVVGSELPPAIRSTTRAFAHVCELARLEEPGLRAAMRYTGAVPHKLPAHLDRAVRWATQWRNP